MIPRQKEIFEHIVNDHIKSGQPVSSSFLVKKYSLDLSPATVRNDMVELEDNGLIYQPHTSAGRVPTEAGYRYYVENYINFNKELPSKTEQSIKEFLKKNSAKLNQEEKIKQLAKVMAEKTSLTSFVGFGPMNVFYTGISNLFTQPEFKNLNLIVDISQVIDRMDEVMSQIYGRFNNLEVKIGAENPFSSDCSIIINKQKNILLGILGPLRMDYQKNIQLINFISQQI